MFHEFVVIEVDADCALKLLQIELLKEQVMILSKGDLTGLGSSCDWKSLHCLDYKTSWEIRTNEADHLMIVQSSYYLIVRCGVEDFLNLLEERFAIELSCRYECILSEEDMLTSKSSVEVFIE